MVALPWANEECDSAHITTTAETVKNRAGRGSLTSAGRLELVTLAVGGDFERDF
jgi:hypothetical protein